MPTGHDQRIILITLTLTDIILWRGGRDFTDYRLVVAPFIVSIYCIIFSLKMIHLLKFRQVAGIITGLGSAVHSIQKCSHFTRKMTLVFGAAGLPVFLLL
eukprot:SAG11_NODE_123_length_15805_cov_15.133261_3_plen_100_part_00